MDEWSELCNWLKGDGVMSSLSESMELAGNNLMASLSPGQGYLPYWRVNIDRELRAASVMMWPSHNIGRWWDAMLRLEAATGFVIPAELEAVMLTHLKSCLDNPLGVCGHLMPWEQFPPGWIDFHSQREALLALAGLVRFRRSMWAAQAGRRMVAALDRYIRPDGRFDRPYMADLCRQAGLAVPEDGEAAVEGVPDCSSVGTQGRMIEGLIEFHAASGDDAALRLADRLGRIYFEISTRPDGTVPQAGYVHTHSLFGTYRGLLLYGKLTRQHEYVERVAVTYAKTVRGNVRPSGFISHDWGKETVGETTSSGDAAQLALWLARAGYGEFLDDAERIIRCRILPSQITQPLGLKPLVENGKDEHLNLDSRVLGAFGYQAHPHGETVPTTDITAADLHTLCDIYTHVVERSDLGLCVNFHFDYEDAGIRIQTGADDNCRRLLLRRMSPTALLIRIPQWTPRESVRLSVDGAQCEPQWLGHGLFVGRDSSDAEVRIEYALPVTFTEETLEGVTYRLKWRGDEVAGITPNTDFRPFYPILR
jgi:hypothetical protein